MRRRATNSAGAIISAATSNSAAPPGAPAPPPEPAAEPAAEPPAAGVLAAGAETMAGVDAKRRAAPAARRAEEGERSTSDRVWVGRVVRAVAAVRSEAARR